MTSPPILLGLFEGGTDDPSNTAGLCAHCHKEKTQQESNYCREAELDAGSGPEGKEADRVSDEAGVFIKKVDQEQSD